jgi:hypothetical protein
MADITVGPARHAAGTLTRPTCAINGCRKNRQAERTLMVNLEPAGVGAQGRNIDKKY